MAAAAILVVDDDPPIWRMLERTLGAEGYEVATAADGAAALVSIERSAPDLVVLDVTMPGLDGLAVCRREPAPRALASRSSCPRCPARAARPGEAVLSEILRLRG